MRLLKINQFPNIYWVILQYQFLFICSHSQEPGASSFISDIFKIKFENSFAFRVYRCRVPYFGVNPNTLACLTSYLNYTQPDFSRFLCTNHGTKNGSFRTNSQIYDFGAGSTIFFVLGPMFGFTLLWAKSELCKNFQCFVNKLSLLIQIRLFYCLKW